MKPLYVKFKRPRTIQEFLIKFFSKARNTHDTHAQHTYHDKECKYLHCSKPWRSINDIYRLVHTYYPSTTLKILMHNLVILRVPHKNKGSFYYPHFGYCGDMGRCRYMPYFVGSGYQTDSGGGYSWKKLFKLIEITGTATFKEYKK